jgi:hypothetical protein
MPEKIGRRTALKTFASLPNGNPRTQDFNYPEVFKTYHLSGGSETDSVQVHAVAKGLTELLQLMGIEELVFLGDNSGPWLFRKGSFSGPVRAARSYLEGLNINERFTGGLLVKVSELLNLLPHVFWLTRANAVPFDANFVDRNETIVCHPCKYFNLHFSTRTKKADKIFLERVSQSGLVLIDAC